MSISKIGQKPITLPQGITAAINSDSVQISGPKGNLSLKLPPKVTARLEADKLILDCQSNIKATKSQYGTARAQLQNMVTGLLTPWSKSIEIIGTGYKFSQKDNQLITTAGFINPVVLDIPNGVQVQIIEETKLVISGSDRDLVGQFASIVRKIRKPEPYKGKGIRYPQEFIKLKPGKAAKTTTTA